jgi:hypothetical protein
MFWYTPQWQHFNKNEWYYSTSKGRKNKNLCVKMWLPGLGFVYLPR